MLRLLFKDLHVPSQISRMVGCFWTSSHVELLLPVEEGDHEGNEDEDEDMKMNIIINEHQDNMVGRLYATSHVKFLLPVVTRLVMLIEMIMKKMKKKT